MIHPLRSINVQKFQGNPFHNCEGILFGDHAATDWNHSEEFSLFRTNGEMTGRGVASFQTPLNNGGGLANSVWAPAVWKSDFVHVSALKGPGVGVPPPSEATSCEVFPFTVIIRNMLI